MNRRWGFLKHFNAALLGLVALGLTACANTDTATPRACPEILIPVDSAKLTRFKPGPGRDIIDVLHEELITGFAHGCVYDTDETGAGNVMVEISPSFESMRGPANVEGRALFEYFIAIADLDKNVLEKARFPVAIPYPSNMNRIQWQRADPIPLTIPLKAGQTGKSVV